MLSVNFDKYLDNISKQLISYAEKIKTISTDEKLHDIAKQILTTSELITTFLYYH